MSHLKFNKTKQKCVISQATCRILSQATCQNKTYHFRQWKGNILTKCTLIFTIYRFFLSERGLKGKSMRVSKVIAITIYLLSCLGQETANEPFGLRVKLPPDQCCCQSKRSERSLAESGGH